MFQPKNDIFALQRPHNMFAKKLYYINTVITSIMKLGFNNGTISVWLPQAYSTSLHSSCSATASAIVSITTTATTTTTIVSIVIIINCIIDGDRGAERSREERSRVERSFDPCAQE